MTHPLTTYVPPVTDEEIARHPDPAFWEGRAKHRDDLAAEANRMALFETRDEHWRYADTYRAVSKQLRGE